MKDRRTLASKEARLGRRGTAGTLVPMSGVVLTDVVVFMEKIVLVGDEAREWECQVRVVFDRATVLTAVLADFVVVTVGERPGLGTLT